MMLLGAFHVHARCSQTLPAYLFSRNCPSTDRNPAQLGFHLRQVAARIHKRSQHHVAANPGKAVEKCDIHLARLVLRAGLFLPKIWSRKQTTMQSAMRREAGSATAGLLLIE